MFFEKTWTREAVEKRVEILAIDPNGYDQDPAAFYEGLESELGALDVAYEMSPSGIGGTVKQTIDTITAALNESPAGEGRAQEEERGEVWRDRRVVEGPRARGPASARRTSLFGAHAVGPR